MKKILIATSLLLASAASQADKLTNDLAQYNLAQQPTVVRHLKNNGVVCKSQMALNAIANIPGAAAELARGGQCMPMDAVNVNVVIGDFGIIDGSAVRIIIYKGYPLYTVEAMLDDKQPSKPVSHETTNSVRNIPTKD